MPPVGQFCIERQSGTAPRLIAYNRYIRQTFKKGYKTIGGAERASVGEDANFLLPAQTCEGPDGDGAHSGEIFVSFARFVLYKSTHHRLVEKK